MQQTLRIAVIRLAKLTGVCKMNKRIAELYNQSIVLEGNADYTAGELDPEKFAKLIVQECSAQCRDDDNAFDILKHFGVE